MKTSTLLFIIATGIVIVVVFFPPLIGIIRINKGEQPIDFVSKFWFEANDARSTKHISENFAHIKIVGNGKEQRNELILVRDDSSFLFSRNPTNYTYYINKDTLVIHYKKENSLMLAVNNPVKTVSIENFNLLLVPNFSLDNAELKISQSSEIYLGKEHYDNRWDTDSIHNLTVSVKDESRLTIRKITIDHLAGVVENSTIRCFPEFNTAGLSIKEIGKSFIVRPNRVKRELP